MKKFNFIDNLSKRKDIVYIGEPKKIEDYSSDVALYDVSVVFTDEKRECGKVDSIKFYVINEGRDNEMSLPYYVHYRNLENKLVEPKTFQKEVLDWIYNNGYAVFAEILLCDHERERGKFLLYCLENGAIVEKTAIVWKDENLQMRIEYVI